MTETVPAFHFPPTLQRAFVVSCMDKGISLGNADMY